MLAAPLSAEDQTVQSMPDASPTKWHLAHTSWFFETFLLRSHTPGYTVFDEAFAYLFNSYYEGVGPRHARPERGLLSRPGVKEIGEYRRHVTSAMSRLIETAGAISMRGESMPGIDAWGSPAPPGAMAIAGAAAFGRTVIMPCFKCRDTSQWFIG